MLNVNTNTHIQQLPSPASIAAADSYHFMFLCIHAIMYVWRMELENIAAVTVVRQIKRNKREKERAQFDGIILSLLFNIDGSKFYDTFSNVKISLLVVPIQVWSMPVYIHVYTYTSARISGKKDLQNHKTERKEHTQIRNCIAH